MDQQTLIDTILREAKRDFFNGRGRIFKSEFLRGYNISEEAFMEAITTMKKLWNALEIIQSPLNEEIFYFNLGGSNIFSE